MAYHSDPVLHRHRYCRQFIFHWLCNLTLITSALLLALACLLAHTIADPLTDLESDTNSTLSDNSVFTCVQRGWNKL